ncbi:unnamed protein product, partial [Symbiodinium pilosum]
KKQPGAESDEDDWRRWLPADYVSQAEAQSTVVDVSDEDEEHQIGGTNVRDAATQHYEYEGEYQGKMKIRRLPTTQEEEWLQDYENRQRDSQERVEILADLREEEATQQAYQEFEEEEMARAIQE